MDYNKPPFSCNYTKDTSWLTPESTATYHTKILCIQDCIPSEQLQSPPSPAGCEQIFRETFLSDEMCLDFPVIFHEFIRLEYSNLPQLTKEASVFPVASTCSSRRMLYQKLFHLMYAALRQEHPNTLSLFRKLYKIYYNQEYQQLKRFHILTYKDVFTLANPSNEDDFVSATARILTASTWFSINQNPDCAAVYYALNRNLERREKYKQDHNDSTIHSCREIMQYITETFPCNILESFRLQLDTLNTTLDLLFSANASDSCRFRPDKQLISSNKQSLPRPSSPAALPSKVFSVSSIDKLQREVTSLRQKLEQQERENRHIHTLYSESRSALSKAESSLTQYENDRQELIALRNHVYQLTENDTILPSSNLDSMTYVISRKKIIIIGGHSNWTYKLKNRFPSWNFLSPKTSGAVDSRLLIHADYVYFFTSIIKHCTYMRFIRIVRDHNIPFGYIHNINISSNIQQIYKDISALSS